MQASHKYSRGTRTPRPTRKVFKKRGPRPWAQPWVWGPRQHKSGLSTRHMSSTCLVSQQSTCLVSQQSTCLVSQQSTCLGSQRTTCLVSQHSTCLLSQHDTCLLSLWPPGTLLVPPCLLVPSCPGPGPRTRCSSPSLSTCLMLVFLSGACLLV